MTAAANATPWKTELGDVMFVCVESGARFMEGESGEQA